MCNRSKIPEEGVVWKNEKTHRRNPVGAIRYRGIELLETHAMADYIHMCLSVPPKYSIAMTIGYLKGKDAIRYTLLYFKPK
jgi:REP element-mobilizing transposase RayT